MKILSYKTLSNLDATERANLIDFIRGERGREREKKKVVKKERKSPDKLKTQISKMSLEELIDLKGRLEG